MEYSEFESPDPNDYLIALKGRFVLADTIHQISKLSESRNTSESIEKIKVLAKEADQTLSLIAPVVKEDFSEASNDLRLLEEETDWNNIYALNEVSQRLIQVLNTIQENSNKLEERHRVPL